MSDSDRVEQIFAFIAVDPEDNTEGIPAFVSASGMLMPMIGADMERIESLMDTAQDIATRTGTKMVIYRFEARVEIGVIFP